VKGVVPVAIGVFVGLLMGAGSVFALSGINSVGNLLHRPVDYRHGYYDGVLDAVFAIQLDPTKVQYVAHCVGPYLYPSMNLDALGKIHQHVIEDMRTGLQDLQAAAFILTVMAAHQATVDMGRASSCAEWK